MELDKDELLKQMAIALRNSLDLIEENSCEDKQMFNPESSHYLSFEIETLNTYYKSVSKPEFKKFYC